MSHSTGRQRPPARMRSPARRPTPPRAAPSRSPQTLMPEAYTSEEFFALERERVFASSWVAVGCSAQLREPGDVLVAEVAGRSIFVVRKQDGRCARSTTCAATAARGCSLRRVSRQALHPLPVPQLGLRPRRTLRRHAAVHRLGHPGRPAGRLRHGRRRRVRPRRLRAAAVARRHVGAARVRQPRRRPRAAVRATSATCPRGPPATASTSGRSPAPRSTRSRPTTSSSPRTSWSTTTCPGCIPGW